MCRTVVILVVRTCLIVFVNTVVCDIVLCRALLCSTQLHLPDFLVCRSLHKLLHSLHLCSQISKHVISPIIHSKSTSNQLLNLLLSIPLTDRGGTYPGTLWTASSDQNIKSTSTISSLKKKMNQDFSSLYTSKAPGTVPSQNRNTSKKKVIF